MHNKNAYVSYVHVFKGPMQFWADRYFFFHVICFSFASDNISLCYFGMTSWLSKWVIMSVQSIPHFCWLFLQSILSWLRSCWGYEIGIIQTWSICLCSSWLNMSLYTQIQSRALQDEGLRKIFVRSDNLLSLWYWHLLLPQLQWLQEGRSVWVMWSKNIMVR